jgi:hypothetical protein
MATNSKNDKEPNMDYHYSYYRATDPINILTASLPPPPVVHEFGPFVAGETRYYDPRIDRWVSQKPIEVQRYSKETLGVTVGPLGCQRQESFPGDQLTVGV